MLCLLRQSAALSNCRSYTSSLGYNTLHHINRGCDYRIRQETPLHRPIQTLLKSMNNSHSGEPEWRGVTGTPGSLERLCSISLRACQLMNPLISAVYQQIVSSNQNEGTSTEKSTMKKEKQDKSAFTIADGLVQRLLISVLFSHVAFRDIVGEEDEDHAEENEEDASGEWWLQVQGLTVPKSLSPLVESTKADIQSLADEYLSPKSNDNTDSDKCSYQRLTVFIDPIDGTREFSTGKGEQCSVCIGFANEHGRAVGGVVYRPLSQPKPTWVAGAESEGYALYDFGEEKSSSANNSSDTGTEEIRAKKMRGGLLTTNGSISPFVESLIEELHMERIKSGGAGNKMMMLLENSISGNDDANGSMVYIQDRGVSRWDTCAAEACLEAFGGNLMKMTHLLETEDDLERGRNQQGESYTYLASQTNLDFISGRANLTKYNCRLSTKEPQPNEKAVDVEQVKQYSNLCGLVAVGREWNTTEGKMHIKKVIERAATRNPPAFD